MNIAFRGLSMLDIEHTHTVLVWCAFSSIWWILVCHCKVIHSGQCGAVKC